MSTVNRRFFLKTSGLSALPILGPALPLIAGENKSPSPVANERTINFVSDGEFYNPTAYLNKLQEINNAKPIDPDSYSAGGAVAALEKKFAEVTGKESAIFMPTGTMANQLAIRVLSGENAKVFVQETSHVYRDEADAAQTVHNKRLIPLAKGETGFTLEELKQGVEYHLQGEVFPSGIGVVSIENPVRRTNGKFIPIEELRKISAYCKEQKFKLHLDGARLYMASAWSGVSIAEYAALFDTVYISLYKYLGANAGAILCGDKVVIDKMHHLIKIYGGSMWRNWSNAAMALHTLEGLDHRLQQSRKRADELFALLNQLPAMKITAMPQGTNLYSLQYANGVDGSKLADTLMKEHRIWIRKPNKSGATLLSVNETILYQDVAKIVEAFKKSLG